MGAYKHSGPSDTGSSKKESMYTRAKVLRSMVCSTCSEGTCRFGGSVSYLPVVKQMTIRSNSLDTPGDWSRPSRSGTSLTLARAMKLRIKQHMLQQDRHIFGDCESVRPDGILCISKSRSRPPKTCTLRTSVAKPPSVVFFISPLFVLPSGSL